MEGTEVKLFPLFKRVSAPAPVRQLNHDGSVEYTCAGCGVRVFMTRDDGFEFPACEECRWSGARTCIEPGGTAPITSGDK